MKIFTIKIVLLKIYLVIEKKVFFSINISLFLLDDDLIFLENEILLNHLRRGNTILQINDESFKLISKKILRRGLPKFFLL